MKRVLRKERDAIQVAPEEKLQLCQKRGKCLNFIHARLGRTCSDSNLEFNQCLSCLLSIFYNCVIVNGRLSQQRHDKKPVTTAPGHNALCCFFIYQFRAYLIE